MGSPSLEGQTRGSAPTDTNSPKGNCLYHEYASAEGHTHIEYKGKAYQQVVLDWLAACIRYTSLQPELRKELTRYVRSIQRWF